ncbi:hypothetical protein [Listeria monocytogenes]|uniref:hypothetical protein n=1 Tax=Listeria monocytogenes TaxID=1639 RepID=UPI000AA5C8D5|nr:hypothetical protein [Listeria monocytogenes]MCW4375520.1 hypothetical protein [Listeria monocytogenes]MDJ1545058.1 hypothetical protein [Listeria monocytogenes]MDJ1550851.1 hypothetical protein [Listeria monocytogenes]MDN7269680.1 hypothetical protein [Listeria monocytogenes]MDN7280160.1 hypothetical protein [Listeria monocytogenes]
MITLRKSLLMSFIILVSLFFVPVLSNAEEFNPANSSLTQEEYDSAMREIHEEANIAPSIDDFNNSINQDTANPISNPTPLLKASLTGSTSISWYDSGYTAWWGATASKSIAFEFIGNISIWQSGKKLWNRDVYGAGMKSTSGIVYPKKWKRKNGYTLKLTGKAYGVSGKGTQFYSTPKDGNMLYKYWN